MKRKLLLSLLLVSLGACTKSSEPAECEPSTPDKMPAECKNVLHDNFDYGLKWEDPDELFILVEACAMFARESLRKNSKHTKMTKRPTQAVTVAYDLQKFTSAAMPYIAAARLCATEAKKFKFNKGMSWEEIAIEGATKLGPKYLKQCGAKKPYIDFMIDGKTKAHEIFVHPEAIKQYRKTMAGLKADNKTFEMSLVASGLLDSIRATWLPHELEERTKELSDKIEDLSDDQKKQINDTIESYAKKP